MVDKTPHAAFCEEYDENAHAIIPNSLVSTKRSRSNLKDSVVAALNGAANDSGYCTAATTNSSSTQSAQSGRKSPVLDKVTMALTKRNPANKDKSLADRPSRDKKKAVIDDTSKPRLHKSTVVNPPPPPPSPTRKDRSDRTSRHSLSTSNKPALTKTMTSTTTKPQSSSRPRKRERETAYVRHYPGSCWECQQGLYHTSTPVEPLPVDYSAYYVYPQQTAAQMYDVSVPSVQDVVLPRRQSTRSHRSTSSYSDMQRPMSFHAGVMPGYDDFVYDVPQMAQYDQGLALPSYAAYADPSLSYGVPLEYPSHPSRYSGEYTRQRSSSKAQHRSSGYGAPVLEYDPPRPEYDQADFSNRRSSREPRMHHSRRSSHSAPAHHDEDSHRMPPPPRPVTHKQKEKKEKPAPQIIQQRPDPPRRSNTNASIPREWRSSKTGETFNMSEMEANLPDYSATRHVPAPATMVPQRSQSVAENRRATSHRRTSRGPGTMTVEDPRRRRQQVYYHYDGSNHGSNMEDKQREAEEYQAARSGRPTPLTTDALVNSKPLNAGGSDSGSQKSRSSRGSDRTQGSATGSRVDDENSIVMNVNGVTMSFPQESIHSKTIRLRRGDGGEVELNIGSGSGSGRSSKKYWGRSDYSGSSGRKEIEDARYPRDDWRSERASRRSSRSTYGSRALYD